MPEEKNKKKEGLMNSSRLINPSEIFVDAEEFSESQDENFTKLQKNDQLNSEKIFQGKVIVSNQKPNKKGNLIEDFVRENARKEIIESPIEIQNSSPDNLNINMDENRKNVKIQNTKQEENQKELILYQSSPSTALNNIEFKKLKTEIFQTNTITLNIFPKTKNELVLFNEKQDDENNFFNSDTSKFPNSKKPEIKHSCLCCNL